MYRVEKVFGNESGVEQERSVCGEGLSNKIACGCQDSRAQ
jgi:hypothetical protein